MAYRGRDQGPRGGAEHLARIHGTEEDKVNCPFYFKIGACRHGDKCSRQHHRPPFSETVIVRHMWNNPMCAIVSSGGNLNMVDKSKLQVGFDEFYEEIFEEFRKFGKLEDVQVCENLGDHMVGNVYIKFYDEEDAQNALTGLNGRFYAGRVLTCEFSPVTDFREARCRQFDEGTCVRGPYCNFMHVCEPSGELRTFLEKEYGFKGGKMKGTGGMDNLRNVSRASSSRVESSKSQHYRDERSPHRASRRDSSRDRQQHERNHSTSGIDQSRRESSDSYNRKRDRSDSRERKRSRDDRR